MKPALQKLQRTGMSKDRHAAFETSENMCKSLRTLLGERVFPLIAVELLVAKAPYACRNTTIAVTTAPK
jgi:hypothetical protein